MPRHWGWKVLKDTLVARLLPEDQNHVRGKAKRTPEFVKGFWGGRGAGFLLVTQFSESPFLPESPRTKTRAASQPEVAGGPATNSGWGKAKGRKTTALRAHARERPGKPPY